MLPAKDLQDLTFANTLRIAELNQRLAEFNAELVRIRQRLERLEAQPSRSISTPWPRQGLRVVK